MKRARNAQDARVGGGKGKPAKNEHAVALGRLGGEASGRTRLTNTDPDTRRRTARIAAKARWDAYRAAARQK